MRRLLSATFAAAALLVAGASGGSDPAAAADPDILTFSGAGPQGRWYQEMSVYGKILTREMPGTTVNGVTGKGVSVGNIKRIAAGQVDGGRFYLMDMEAAHKKQGPFESGDYSKSLVWMKLGTHLFRVIAEKDVKKFSDLKGKKVAIGQKGSGDDLIAERILAGYGVTRDNTEFQYLGREEGQAAFGNRQIDAIAYLYARNNQGHLGPVFAARKLGEDIEFVEPDADKNDAFVKSDPTFFIDGYGEPVFERPDLTGVAVYQGMAISADLSEDLVYKMTKILYENWDEVTDALPWWKEPGEASLETAAIITTAPYHPGAIRYYKEKGVWQKYHAD